MTEAELLSLAEKIRQLVVTESVDGQHALMSLEIALATLLALMDNYEVAQASLDRIANLIVDGRNFASRAAPRAQA